MAINELLPVLKIIENHYIIYNTVKYMTLKLCKQLLLELLCGKMIITLLKLIKVDALIKIKDIVW